MKVSTSGKKCSIEAKKVDNGQSLGKRKQISVNITPQNKTVFDTGRFCHASDHVFSENQEKIWTNNAKSKKIYEMNVG